MKMDLSESMENKLFKLDKKLDKIDEKVSFIQNGIKRNDAHITFVTRVYFMLKNPLIKLLNFFGRNDYEPLIENDEVYLKINNY